MVPHTDELDSAGLYTPYYIPYHSAQSKDHAHHAVLEKVASRQGENCSMKSKWKWRMSPKEVQIFRSYFSMIYSNIAGNTKRWKCLIRKIWMGKIICMRSIVWQMTKDSSDVDADDELQKIWQTRCISSSSLSASLWFAEKNRSLSFWGENVNYYDAFVSSCKSNDAAGAASLRFVA